MEGELTSPPPPPQETGIVAPGSGGVIPDTGVKPSAKIADGRIALPVGAPQYAVDFANAASTIAAEKPGYRLGGGHKQNELEDFLKYGKVSSAYDCSGFAGTPLVAAGLHRQVLPSGSYMGWGKAYRKKVDEDTAWVHVYAHGGHLMAQIGSADDGVFIDTSNRAYGLSGKGPIITERSRRVSGFRHRVPSKRVLARAARIAKRAANNS